MRCPACQDYQSPDTMKVAKHMMAKFDKPHTDWIKAHGLNPVRLLAPSGKGNYKPLAELLEKLALGKN